METEYLFKNIAAKIMELILNTEIEDLEPEDEYSFDQESVDIVNSFGGAIS